MSNFFYCYSILDEKWNENANQTIQIHIYTQYIVQWTAYNIQITTSFGVIIRQWLNGKPKKCGTICICEMNSFKNSHLRSPNLVNQISNLFKISKLIELIIWKNLDSCLYQQIGQFEKIPILSIEILFLTDSLSKVRKSKCTMRQKKQVITMLSKSAWLTALIQSNGSGSTYLYCM